MMMARKHQEGFTLLELLSYLAILGMLLVIIYTTFHRLSRNISTADGTLLKERGAFSAVRTMQADIRRSVGALDAFGPFSVAGGALILSMDDLDEADGEIIIYRLDEPEGTLIRHETRTGQPSYGVSSRRVGFFVEEFDFEFDENNTNLLQVNILVKTGRLGVLRNRPLTFHALMRNG